MIKKSIRWGLERIPTAIALILVYAGGVLHGAAMTIKDLGGV